jgi:hypothetical protein
MPNFSEFPCLCYDFKESGGRMVGAALSDVSEDDARWTLNVSGLLLKQLENATDFGAVPTSATPRRHLGVAMEAIITTSYVLGVVS